MSALRFSPIEGRVNILMNLQSHLAATTIRRLREKGKYRQLP
jgi:hypothetical protein